ncbi:MAG: ATP-dependent helicase, partial [Candidatus Nanoarchaeia archaeon]
LVSPYIGTMHSLFLRILRGHATLMGYRENFTLIDDADKNKIVKNILKEQGVTLKANEIYFFVSSIGKFKNRGVAAEELDPSLKLEEQGMKEFLIDDEILYIDAKLKNLVPLVYQKYQANLKANGVLDLDDILLLMYKLLEKHEKLKEYYSKKFKIIMVDEAQDLNVVQMNILNLLQRDNLCLIGDDCQNIYEWRGSSNDLVFRFNEDYQKVVLKENYRSTKEIILVVNKTIAAMKSKIEKELVCTRLKGEQVGVEGFDSFQDEADFVIGEVKELLKRKVAENKIAVLFRTNNIGKLVEREFLKNKVPCHLARSKNFFEREEVKDLLSFLKLKVNMSSLPDFERVVSLVEGVGEVKIKRIGLLAKQRECSYFDLIREKQVGLSLGLQDRLSSLKKVLENTNRNPITLFLEFFKYKEMLERAYKNDNERVKEKLENVQVLMELFEGHDQSSNGVKEFLDGLIELEKREGDKDKVTLSTIHGAKGLEWDHVFLIECNEGVLPYYRDSLSTLQRDSELRLFYVALSRAKDFLTITYANSNGWKEMRPSSFLEIIYDDFRDAV